MLDKRYSILGIVAVSLLAGCGGGGGGGETPAKSTTEVMASLPSGTTLALDRSASSTVTGTDSAGAKDASGATVGNGIRDDVDTWIAAQGYSAGAQANAVVQLAKAYQTTLSVSLTDDTALRAARLASSDAVECIMQRAPDVATGYKIVSDLRRVTINTDARVKAYLAYVEKVNDTVARAPEGDGCVN